MRGNNSRGVIAISRRNRDITEDDVYRVIDQARAVSVPTDREIIDVLPQEFTVDGQDGIGNPIGVHTCAAIRAPASIGCTDRGHREGLHHLTGTVDRQAGVRDVRHHERRSLGA